MSVFGSIMNAVFGHGSALASTSPTATPSTPPAQTVDVAAIVEKAAAAKGEKLAWRTSIVDLMKAPGLDSSPRGYRLVLSLQNLVHYVGGASIAASASSPFSASLTARAQQTGKLPTIGILGVNSLLGNGHRGKIKTV